MEKSKIPAGGRKRKKEGKPPLFAAENMRFWLLVRQVLLTIVREIEKHYKMGGG